MRIRSIWLVFCDMSTYENPLGVLSYFGEDPAMTSTDFFGTLNKFVAAFDSARECIHDLHCHRWLRNLTVRKLVEVVKRIEKAKMQEEKKRKAALAKEKAKEAAKAVKVAKNTPERAIQGQQKQQPKGKLDLTGQRKQFADPFAGPDDVKQQPKGKLDLTGQRKQFADPFAGPDDVRDDRADDKPAGETPKSGIAALAAAAAAKKMSNRVNAESSADNEPSSGTDPEEKSPPGIGALAAAAALKKKSHEDESSDPETKPMPPLSRAPPMGIAAMAAAAAQAKKSSSQEDGISSPGTNGFFPAANPPSPTKELSPQKSNKHVNAREERYLRKTSSDARQEEAVLHAKSDDFACPPASPMAKGMRRRVRSDDFACPPASPMANGIRREVVEAGRASLRHIKVPMLELDSVPPPPPFESPDPKTEAKVMLVG